MKLYTSLGPNPRMVNLFLREKGLEIPTEQVDIMGAENRREPYLRRNPAGQLPCLELDDGRVIGETVGQPFDPALANVSAWYARMGERASVKEG